MRPEDRALLQERVRTLVLQHALEAALDRIAGAVEGAGRDAEAELMGLEGVLLAAARGVADQARTQKLAVMAATEDAAGTIRAAFDNAHRRLERPPRDLVPDDEPEAAAAWALVA